MIISELRVVGTNQKIAKIIWKDELEKKAIVVSVTSMILVFLKEN